jgi:hypothetical protein
MKFLQKMSNGVALSSSAAIPRLGHSVIETFFYSLRKRARSGRGLQVPEQSLNYEPDSAGWAHFFSKV